jgi:hypothetical protein
MPPSKVRPGDWPGSFAALAIHATGALAIKSRNSSAEDPSLAFQWQSAWRHEHW